MPDEQGAEAIALGITDFLFTGECHDEVPVDIAHAVDCAVLEALGNHNTSVEATIPVGDGRTLYIVAVVE